MILLLEKSMTMKVGSFSSGSVLIIFNTQGPSNGRGALIFIKGTISIKYLHFYPTNSPTCHAPINPQIAGLATISNLDTQTCPFKSISQIRALHPILILLGNTECVYQKVWLPAHLEEDLTGSSLLLPGIPRKDKD